MVTLTVPLPIAKMIDRMLFERWYHHGGDEQSGMTWRQWKAIERTVKAAEPRKPPSEGESRP